MIKITKHAMIRINQRGIDINEILQIPIKIFEANYSLKRNNSILIEIKKNHRIKIVYRIEDEAVIVITCFRI